VRYANFDLWVDLESSGVLKIRARDSRKGTSFRSDAPFLIEKVQIESTELYRSVREVRFPDRPVPKKARKVGGELFQAVFRKPIYGLWCAALAQAEKDGSGVRLRLTLSEELWDWPWEWLFDCQSGFLAYSTSPPISIVRYIDESGPSRSISGVVRVGVLVVAAQPRCQDPLDVEAEWNELKRGLARLLSWRRVRLERLESPTLSQLRERLFFGTFHVLHFIGHGGLNANGEGAVLFENAEGGQEAVDGLTLGPILARHSSLRLVVLNACEGARDGNAPFAGVAQSLVRYRIPAVVAMQDPIRDQDAIRFSRHFYAGLVRGGSVDRALSHALIGMLADNPGRGRSTPVLYLRVPDGILFPFPWKLVGAMLLSLLLVAFAFAGPSLIDPEAPPYAGPPSPSLPATASTEGCPRSELLGMTFVRIPEGTFTMGSKPRAEGELEHEVTISKPFCMSVYEVTRGQWRKIMRAAPGEAGLSDDLPVAGVSWKDAQKFLRKLNQRERGAGYRLAWEAEWEYAARGGSTTDFSFGDDPDDLYQHGNCKASDGHEGLASVGSFQPNAWGLYDMHGNVSEWVEDWFGPYTGKHETAPQGPRAGGEKVRRGGSFEITPKNCTAVFRTRSRPEYRSDDVGFRLVREVTPPA
jgi:sulfatase modifying factor 1